MKVAPFTVVSLGLASGCMDDGDILNAAVALAPAAINVASASTAGASPIGPANGYSQRGAFEDCAALYAGVDPARAAECQRRAANMSSLY